MPQLKAVMSLLKGNAEPTSPKYGHLQPSRGQGDGVTVNATPDDGALIFMGGFFDDENQLRLVRRDGTVVRKWPLDYLSHFPDAETRPCSALTDPLQTDTHGAHITPEGEVVVTYEYCGAVKLDQCGNLMWSVAKPTHHSLIAAEGGGYLTLGEYAYLAAENRDRFPPFSQLVGTSSELPKHKALRLWQRGYVHEDTVVRLSEDGAVVEEFSIPQILVDNDLGALLTARDVTRSELTHGNKVAELTTQMADAYPMFEAGDLAISMRSLNLVMVIDAQTHKVKWHQTGPWLRQHDPEFRADGRISVFNNNTYHYLGYKSDQTDLSRPFTTNILAIDPQTRQTEVLFGERPGQEMLSVIRGEHEILADGGTLIGEFDGGRVIEVSADGEVVWEYVNKYDDEYVGEIVNVALHPAEYFTAQWKACSQ